MSDFRISQVYLGIAIGTLAIAIRGEGGWAMWTLIAFAAFLTISAIFLWTKCKRIKRFIRKLEIDYLLLLLGLLNLSIVMINKGDGWVIAAIIVLLGAIFIYLPIRLYKESKKVKKVKHG